MTLAPATQPFAQAPSPSLPLAATEADCDPVIYRRRCSAALPASTAWPDAVAAFAEVLRTWSGTDRFGLRVRREDGQDSLLVTEYATTFGDRLAQVTEQLQASQCDALAAAYPITVAGDVSGDVPACVSLELRLSWTNGSLRCDWLARDALFPPGMMSDMFGAFERLLALLAETKDLSCSWFDLLPQWQLDIRAMVNDTATPVAEELLHAAVASHARQRPDTLAVITRDRQLTYREFAARVNQVGRRLRDLGVRPNQLVAVLMEKGWEQIVAAHGIVAAGAAYLPVDLANPAERIRLILEHGQVSYVLTQSRIDARVEWPSQVTALRVDRDFDGIDEGPLEEIAAPGDLAYVIFTSGSTGAPKGVMIDHRGAVNTIRYVNRLFATGLDDRCLALSGLHFDLSVYDTFGPLAAGGAVVVPDPAPKPDPEQWSRLVEDFQVTLWNSVPAFMEMLTVYLELTRKQHRLRSLRVAILSGDWIPLNLPDRIRALNGEVEIYSSGGPAETCIWSVIYKVGEIDPTWISIPYGRAIANQQYHVLDGNLRPCPVWVPGQMYVTSEIGLARGYWRDPALTARQFIVLPAGSRAYATGDLGRFRPDGTIDILGRTDFQVKIQGVRIELGEIEAVLRGFPGVKSAVIVSIGMRDLPSLHGFVERQPGVPRPDVSELREFLLSKLPAHMVPARLTVLDGMPLTGNGKVDRRSLMTARYAAE